MKNMNKTSKTEDFPAITFLINELRTAFHKHGSAKFELPETVPNSLLLEAQNHLESSEAESAEIKIYNALLGGLYVEACYLCVAAEEFYKKLKQEADRDFIKGLRDNILIKFFPPYKRDKELLEDLKGWTHQRLWKVYGPTSGRFEEHKETNGIADSFTPSYILGNGLQIQEPSHTLLPSGEPVSSYDTPEHTFELRLQATRDSGTKLRIDKFAERLSLNAHDRAILLLLLTIEMDTGFHNKRRQWVNDDAFYSVGFILNLLTDSYDEVQKYLARLNSRAPLIRHQLVYLNTTASRLGTPLHNHLIELDECVCAFGHDRPHWPQGIDSIARIYEVQERPGQAYFKGKLEKLERVMLRRQSYNGLNKQEATSTGQEIAYVGINGMTLGTTRALALTFATEHCRPLLEMTNNLQHLNTVRFEQLFRLIVREALLHNAVIFIDGTGGWEDDSGILDLLRAIERCAPYYGQPILFDCPLPGDDVLKRELSPFFEIRILPPTLDEQVVIWQEALSHTSFGEMKERDLRTRVCDMALSVEDIHRAVSLAADNAWLNSEDDVCIISPDSLRAMATSKLNRGLHAIADRVTTTLTWNDVILPNSVLEQLMEIVTYARYQRKVYEEWGFGAKMPYGRANSSLFTGPPGTGKTMVAGIIAHELGMDLFRIEMSQVISKFIGETEKNLGKVFDEASRSHAVILFDEADSLFAKRTEVKSHHDRYSNLEVNYLLQRIEEFDGITILTSNFPKNIDDAFARRLKFKINFPIPSEKERIKLWKLMIPSNVTTKKIDFERIGKVFEFTGANIKDAVVRSAFQAAERGKPIDSSMLEEAGIAVYREMGKLIRVKDGRIHLPEQWYEPDEVE